MDNTESSDTILSSGLQVPRLLYCIEAVLAPGAGVAGGSVPAAGGGRVSAHPLHQLALPGQLSQQGAILFPLLESQERSESTNRASKP